MTSGIYCIKNKKTDQMYIGLSKNIEERWKQHCKKSEQSIRIDRIINQEDKNNFDLIIIEKLPPIDEMLSNREKYWIKYFNTFENDFHYNDSPGGQYDTKSCKEHATIVSSGYRRGKKTYQISYQGQKFFRTESKQVLKDILEKFFDENLILLQNYTIEDLKREGRKLLIKNNMSGRNSKSCLWKKIDELGGVNFLREKKNMGKTQKSVTKELGFTCKVIINYLHDQDLSWRIL